MVQFPAELEQSALQIVHHSTQPLPELINDVYNAHRLPLVPGFGADAVSNGGIGKHPMSKPSISVWIYQVRIPALLCTPCVCATARLTPIPD